MLGLELEGVWDPQVLGVWTQPGGPDWGEEL
jgi:hypothetical protein